MLELGPFYVYATSMTIAQLVVGEYSEGDFDKNFDICALTTPLAKMHLLGAQIGRIHHVIHSPRVSPTCFFNHVVFPKVV